jgi:hypothetical protein
MEEAAAKAPGCRKNVVPTSCRWAGTNPSATGPRHHGTDQTKTSSFSATASLECSKVKRMFPECAPRETAARRRSRRPRQQNRDLGCNPTALAKKLPFHSARAKNHQRLLNVGLFSIKPARMRKGRAEAPSRRRGDAFARVGAPFLAAARSSVQSPGPAIGAPQLGMELSYKFKAPFRDVYDVHPPRVAWEALETAGAGGCRSAAAQRRCEKSSKQSGCGARSRMNDK